MYLNKRHGHAVYTEDLGAEAASERAAPRLLGQERLGGASVGRGGVVLETQRCDIRM